MFEKLKAEFPKFDLSTLPAIPADWVDVSWHNDACPSFEAVKDTIFIYVDFANAAEREFPETPRYSVVVINDRAEAETPFDSDDWAAVLAAVACLKIGRAMPDGFDAAAIEQKIKLAREFSQRLGDHVRAAAFCEIVDRNKRRAHPDICHSHDFCDANMVMLDAFKATLGRSPAFLRPRPDADESADFALWGDAWQIAKAADFFA